MAKLLGKLALFLVIIILVNLTVTELLPSSWAAPDMSDVLAYYDQYGEQYDTLFMGSSRIRRGINPKVFDNTMSKSHPTHTLNLAMGAHRFTRTYQIFLEIMANKPSNLRALVFELQPLDFDPGVQNLHTPRLVFWYTPRDTLFLVRATMAEDLPMADRIRFSRYHVISLVEKLLNAGMGVDIIEFARRDSELTEEQIKKIGRTSGFYDPEGNNDQSKQIRSAQLQRKPELLDTRTQESADGFALGNAAETFNPVYAQRLNEMLRLADENGVDLYFLLAPRLGTSYQYVVPAFNSLPPEHRISVADPDTYYRLYELENSWDVGHLNKQGAAFFSRSVARELRTLLDDKSRDQVQSK